MVAPLAVIGAASSIISIGSSIFGGMGGSDDAKKAARHARIVAEIQTRLMNEDAIEAGKIEYAAHQERIRKMDIQFAGVKGIARARMGASGVSGASQDVYMHALETQQQKERDWDWSVTESKILAGERSAGMQEMTIAGGASTTALSLEAAGNASMWGGIGAAAQVGAGLFGSIAKMFD